MVDILPFHIFFFNKLVFDRKGELNSRRESIVFFTRIMGNIEMIPKLSPNGSFWNFHLQE